jgi:hypothetical protein
VTAGWGTPVARGIGETERGDDIRWYYACKSSYACRGANTVSTRRISSAILFVAAIALLIVALPSSAEAQRRRGPSRVVRSQVIVGYGYYPRYYYDPWYQWGPYGYPYPPYGYGYGFRDELTTSVKLEIDQRDAEVFVDGYRAGIVDDFDGTFQRLRLRPGAHDLTVYLDGFRTIHENVYLSSGSDKKIRLTMERLREGERSEAPPQPEAGRRYGRDDGDAPDDEPVRMAPRRPAPPRAPEPPREVEPRGRESDREPSPSGRFGTLSIRVQPADAEIVIDGERWGGPADRERVSIELSEGRHRVEVRKSGLTTYSEEVLIRRGATLTLNVSLR